MKKHFQIPVYALVAVCLSLFVAGCSKENPWENPGPKESFETFMMDLWRGERVAAFESIWGEDRQRLMAADEELRKVLPDAPPLEPEEWLVVGRMDNPFDIRRLDVVSGAGAAYEAGDRVTVEMQYFDDRTGHVEMVWGGDRWYVALSKPAVDVKLPADVVVADDVDVDGALQLQDQDVSNSND